MSHNVYYVNIKRRSQPTSLLAQKMLFTVETKMVTKDLTTLPEKHAAALLKAGKASNRGGPERTESDTHLRERSGEIYRLLGRLSR